MLQSIYQISGIGPRSEMQDCIENLIDKERNQACFIVADGIGGQPHGKDASVITTSSLVSYFNEHAEQIKNQNFAGHLSKALDYTQQKFASFIRLHTEAQLMGAAMAGLFIESKQMHVFWSGDCRVYQLRNNEVIYSSIPHTWAYDRYRSNLLTEEEAGWSVQNYLTASVNNYTESLRYEIQTIEYKKGDMLLLCSDGIWNCFEQDHFFDMIQKKSIDQIHTELSNQLRQNATDNYSGYLIRI